VPVRARTNIIAFYILKNIYIFEENILLANSYTQIYLHIIIVVLNRTNLIKSENKTKIEKYINGHLTNKKHKLIAINCMPDHTHLLISISPDISISNIVRELKISSANFINDNKLTLGRFYWQTGYAAFSCSKSIKENVVRYIQNQEAHHKKKTFHEEYISFLKKYEISYDEKYIIKI
jgi:putative transposase